MRRDAGELFVVVPETFCFETPSSQQWLYKVVTGVLRSEAERLLVPRTAELAAAFGIRYYRRITVKNVRTRWGSCSSLGNINLSLWLMLLPSRLSDYVIKHELAHLDEMNHGPRFWAELDRMTGGRARELRKETNDYAARFLAQYR